VNRRSGEAGVSITVVRADSDRPPVFQLQKYSTTITENFDVNASVINTRAIDPGTHDFVQRFHLKRPNSRSAVESLGADVPLL